VIPWWLPFLWSTAMSMADQEHISSPLFAVRALTV
jgi:hypothetical protein